jgi:hypothetical protein
VHFNAPQQFTFAVYKYERLGRKKLLGRGATPPFSLSVIVRTATSRQKERDKTQGSNTPN